MTLFKPRPKFPAPDFINGALLHSQNPSNIGRWNIQFPDRRDLLLSQPRSRDGGAFEMSPVGALIVAVFFSGRPSKIVRAIIEGIAVVVSNLVPWRWLRSVERCAHQFVDGVMVHSSIQPGERHLGVFHPYSAAPMLKDMPNLRSTPRVAARSVSTDVPKVGNAVVRVVLDCKPDFFKVIGISHSAGPLRGGQGRALLKQRFRPAFPSRITVCSQGIPA